MMLKTYHLSNFECLSLEHLDMIWCRSNAEYVTLVTLLSKKNLLSKYRDKISVKQASSLFYLSSIYIKQVDLLNTRINFSIANVQLSDNTKIQVHFTCGIIKTIFNGFILVDKTAYYVNLTDYRELIQREQCYEVNIYIDEEFVYCGTWNEYEEMPF